jgi:hypothetical protein
MNKKEYSAFLKSFEWKAVRNEFLNSAPICMMCGRSASAVHHTKYEEGVKGYLDISYLFPLCESCHTSIHRVQKLIAGQESPDYVRSVYSAFVETAPVCESGKDGRYAKRAYRFMLLWLIPDADDNAIFESLHSAYWSSDVCASDCDEARKAFIDYYSVRKQTYIVEVKLHQLNKCLDSLKKKMNERSDEDGNT